MTWEPIAFATAPPGCPAFASDREPKVSGIWAPKARTVAPAVVWDIPVTEAAISATLKAALLRAVTQTRERRTEIKALHVDGLGEPSG